MYYVTKELEFCGAHRLVNYRGKCSNIHGHAWVVKVALQSDELDSLGMVVDFKEIKQVQEWLDFNWDHKLILAEFDPIVLGIEASTDIKDEWLSILTQSIITVPWNPTAENMAKFIFDLTKERFHCMRVTVCQVEVFETPTSKATYKGEDNG